MKSNLLLQIQDELRKLGDVAGSPEIKGDQLHACDSNLRLTIHLDESNITDAEMIHCHVVAQIGSYTGDNLNAGIVGVGSTPDDRVRELAQAWVGLVGAPILSLLNQASVLGSEHFSQESRNGVPFASGFLGPRLSLGLPDHFDWDEIQQRNLFENVDAFAPADNLQLAKVVINAENGKWNRHIEINGQAYSFEENNFDLGVEPPEFGVITQFAIFHFADNQEWIEQRQNIDNAICHFVAAFSETQDVQASLDKMRSLGIDEQLVHDVHAFSALAFSRVLFGDLGATYSECYDRILSNGTVKTTKLISHPVYGRSYVMSSKFSQGNLFDSFQTLALLNTEFNELNDKLNQGLEPKEIKLQSPVIPDLDVDEDSIAKASKKILKTRK